MKAAVLGIGTELTEGQTLNRNASWISKKLKDRGLQTSVHIVVPDDRKLILSALDYCAEKADVLFVTGGLGPTSDDFTRDVISEWTDHPLEFDEKSWVQVQNRLTSRGYTIKEIQRQQCYFPKSAEILTNTEGTANGFSLNSKQKKIVVLPGPPKEIEAIWNNSLEGWLQEAAKTLDPQCTLLWETLGIGESDVAILVEEVLKNVDVDRGYRVHLPYVEVKLMFPASKKTALQPTIELLDKALAHCTFSKSDEDSALILAKELGPWKNIAVYDQVTESFLVNRLAMAFKDQFKEFSKWQFSNDAYTETLPPTDKLVLTLTKLDEYSCLAQIYQGTSHRHSETIVAPYKTANMLQRRLQYFAEMALIFWIQKLKV